VDGASGQASPGVTQSGVPLNAADAAREAD